MLSENFSDIVDMLILEKQRTTPNPQHIMYLSPMQYLMEFRTIHLDCGRRVGKTEYIKRNSTGHSIIIVMNPQAKRLYPKDKNVFTISQIANCNHDVFCDFKPDIIYIDEPFLCSRIYNIENVYAKFNNYDNLFVLLGK